MDTRRVRLIYPENRTVSAATVMGWAADDLANGETEEVAEDLEHAIAIEQDLGHITVEEIL